MLRLLCTIVNNSAAVPKGSFDRVAYYLQLDGNYASTSFDAAGFTIDANKIAFLVLLPENSISKK